MTVTVLVPDAPWAHAADWRGLDVALRSYAFRAEAMEGDPEAEVVIVATAPTPALVDMLGRLPKLKAIQALYAGTESWVGKVPEGVMLINASGAHGGATAEVATAGLLAMYRALPEFLVAQAEGRWAYRVTDTLAGKRVLIIGAGDVGQSTARQVAVFGALPELAARTAREGVRALDEALAAVGDFDVVVLATPLTDDTRGMVDAAFLARMKDGAVLVNIGRGPLVDTDALLAELQAGRLRAVLDVTDPEPLPEGHALWKAPGLILTPHVGGSVEGAQAKAMRVAIDQIAALVAGKTPSNLVTPR